MRKETFSIFPNSWLHFRTDKFKQDENQIASAYLILSALADNVINVAVGKTKSVLDENFFLSAFCRHHSWESRLSFWHTTEGGITHRCPWWFFACLLICKLSPDYFCLLIFLWCTEVINYHTVKKGSIQNKKLYIHMHIVSFAGLPYNIWFSLACWCFNPFLGKFAIEKY